jgi:hypothetical protein
MNETLGTNILSGLITEAQNASTSASHTRPGFDEPTSYFEKPAASFGTVNLNASYLPRLLPKDGNLSSSPLDVIVTKGGERLTLSAGILQLSRVASAGSHIIVKADPNQALPTGREGSISLVSVAKYFNTIEAAPFISIADDTDITASLLPLSRDEIVWHDSLNKAVRFEIKRKDIKQIGNDVFVGEIMLSLIMGLARAADEILLSRIIGSLPVEFDPSLVAAQGLRFPELSAMIGTNGTGALVTANGELVAKPNILGWNGGIHAELTGDIDQTIIGAFNRSAVAIHENISITCERRNLQGDLVVTAYANMVALMPDPSKFWTVAG